LSRRKRTSNTERPGNHATKSADSSPQGSFRNAGPGEGAVARCDDYARWRRTLSEMKWLMGCAALVSAAVLVAAGGSSHHMTAHLRQRIAVGCPQDGTLSRRFLPFEGGVGVWASLLPCGSARIGWHHDDESAEGPLLRDRPPRPVRLRVVPTPAWRSIAARVDCHEDLVAGRARRRLRYAQQDPRVLIPARPSHPDQPALKEQLPSDRSWSRETLKSLSATLAGRARVATRSHGPARSRCSQC
jgi:hypothetical protein